MLGTHIPEKSWEAAQPFPQCTDGGSGPLLFALVSPFWTLLREGLNLPLVAEDGMTPYPQFWSDFGLLR